MDNAIDLFHVRRKKRIETRKDAKNIQWISTEEGAHIPLVNGESVGGWSKGKKFSDTGKGKDYFSEIEKNGTYINDSIKPYRNNENFKKVISGIDDVYKDFGMSLSDIKEVGTEFISKKKGSAGMNGMGKLTISKELLENGDDTNDTYTVNGTCYGTGAHEAGHGVLTKLYKTMPLEKIYGGKVPEKYLSENYARSMARKEERLEKSIIKEAKKRYGSNPVISKYGSTSFAEKVSEAFADVYANKDKAKEYSRVIVDIVKEYF